MSTEAIVIFITASNEDEAATIGTALVTEQLAACSSIVRGIRSIYRWEGKLCDETECLMIVKTTRDKFSAVENRVKALHSYDVPEVIALPVTQGFKPYLDWIETSTQAIA